MTIKKITPRIVTVQQGYKVRLEREGTTRNVDNYTVTMFYGKRLNGTKIYSVPVFKHNILKKEMVGKAVGTL